jgi:DNA-binding response OmpR family regulator
MATPQFSYTALIVEDNEAHQYVLAKQLRDAGYQTAVAGTVAKALAAVHELPTIVLLDVNLPDGNGFQICREIRRNTRTREIPVVFISNTHQTAASRDEGMEAGGDAFLFPPVHPASLLAVVNGCIERRKNSSRCVKWEAHQVHA